MRLGYFSKCQYIKKKIKTWLCNLAHVGSNSSFFTYVLLLEANEPLLGGCLVNGFHI